VRHSLDEAETAIRFVDAIADSLSQVCAKVRGCACLGLACHLDDEIARVSGLRRSGRCTIYATATRYLQWGD